MTVKERTVTFSVQGEFITKLAREQFHYEGRGSYALKLLLSAMDGTGLDPIELQNMAMAILDGRAELYGTYPGEEYGFRYLDEQDNKWSIFKTLGDKDAEISRLKKENEKTTQKLYVALQYVPENRWNDVMAGRSYDDIEEDYKPSPMVQSFLDRWHDDKKHETEDYGWLEPDGTFHEVEYGHHQAWAEQYIRDNMPLEDWLQAGVHREGQFQTGLFRTFGDFLIDRGWVMLDNPSVGIAIATKNPQKPYTKQQKDFLYGYYIDRNQNDTANEIMQED